MSVEKLPRNKLKLLYVEILKGFSSTYHNNDLIYIKHFTNFDIGDVDLKQEHYYEKAKKEGLPTYKEKEEYLIKEGFWDPHQDNLVFDYKKYLENLKNTKSKLFKENDLTQINKNIEETQSKITKIEDEKIQLIQFTAETFAAKKIHEYYIFNSFFKDQDLSNSLFSEEDFDELDEEDLLKLTGIYNQIIGRFNQLNLQRVALYPSFFNYFCLSESAYEFYGKPIIHLTLYQAECLSHAKYFKNILQNSKAKPTEEMFDQPDKLIEWHESQQNVQETLSKTKNSNNDPSSLMGLTQKDKEKLGIDDSQPNVHTKLVMAAKNKGNELNLVDIMKVMGH